MNLNIGADKNFKGASKRPPEICFGGVKNPKALLNSNFKGDEKDSLILNAVEGVVLPKGHVGKVLFAKKMSQLMAKLDFLKFNILQKAQMPDGSARFDSETVKFLAEKIKVKSLPQAKFLKYLVNEKAPYNDESPLFLEPEIIQNMHLKVKNNDDIDLCRELLPEGRYYDQLSAIVNRGGKGAKPPIFASEKFAKLSEAILKKTSLKEDSEGFLALNDKISNLSYLAEAEIKDEVLKKEFEKGISSMLKARKIDVSDAYDRLDALTWLAEISHSSNNLSQSLGGDTYKCAKFFLNTDKDTETMYKLTLKDISDSLIQERVKPFDANPYRASMVMKSGIENDPLKTYLSHKAVENPQFAKHLYDNYYLPRLSEDARAVCSKISEKYGTKVFIEDESSPLAAKLVLKEFDEWENASKGQFYSPPVIVFNRHQISYSKNNWNAYCNYETNALYMKAEAPDDIMWALRHELVHANDEVAKDGGVINGVNFDKIQANRIYADELQNAGLDYDMIDYAYTNKSEFIAKAAEGDTSKYSDEFKKILIKFGMPEYIFEMSPQAEKFTIDLDKYGKRVVAEDLFGSIKNSSKPILKSFRNDFKDIEGASLSFKLKTAPKMVKEVENKIEQANLTMDELNYKNRRKMSKRALENHAKTFYELDSLSASLEKNYTAFKNSIPDALSQTLLVKNPGAEKMEKIAQKLIKGIERGDYFASALQNGTNSRLSFNKSQVERIAEACAQKGIKTIVQECGEENAKLNLVHKNGLLSELNILEGK